MNIRFTLLGLLISPLLLNCQQSLPIPTGQTNTTAETSEEAPTAVAASNGDVYDVQCLRDNAQDIVSQGRAAASSCLMGNVADQAQEGNGRGVRWSGYASFDYYYYPPTYYSGTNSSNYFCKYIFDVDFPNGSQYNCYSNFFGYNPTNYTYYKPNCQTCYTKTKGLFFKKTYSTCNNTCNYQSNNFSWYYSNSYQQKYPISSSTGGSSSNGSSYNNYYGY